MYQLYCVVQCCIILYYVVLYCIAHCIIFYNIVFYHTVLRSYVLYFLEFYSILCNSEEHSIIIVSTVLSGLYILFSLQIFYLYMNFSLPSFIVQKLIYCFFHLCCNEIFDCSGMTDSSADSSSGTGLQTRILSTFLNELDGIIAQDCGDEGLINAHPLFSDYLLIYSQPSNVCLFYSF